MTRDHFVSKFYLEGFCDPNPPPGKRPALSVYSKKQKSWKVLTPENVAVETDYYTVSAPSGAKDRRIEEALSAIESRAARIIRERVEARRPLNDEERTHFALFVASMLERVPATLDSLRRAHDEIWDLVKLWGTPLPAERPRHQTGSLAWSTLKVALDTTAPIILEMGWRFVFSGSGDYFVASDHPVCMVDPTNERPIPTGLLSPGMQIWFPVTKSILMMAVHGESPLGYVTAPDKTTRIANLLTIARAKRFIAAPSRGFASEELLERFGEGSVPTKP
jgi:hypothetical protein